jgi:hypothetical protein
VSLLNFQNRKEEETAKSFILTLKGHLGQKEFKKLHKDMGSMDKRH